MAVWVLAKNCQWMGRINDNETRLKLGLQSDLSQNECLNYSIYQLFIDPLKYSKFLFLK